MKRYEIFKQFKQFVQKKDERPMDTICASGTSEFALQAQQNFLREYMRTYPKWKNLLLYHSIGAGKTCTAITMAEEYLRAYPKNKVRVILPARLRTNFLDELISPCAMETYLSKQEVASLMASSTPPSQKKKLKAKYIQAVEQKYDIMSFEKFKLKALKETENFVTWMETFTKDSLIIVDEVHNLLSDKYDVAKSQKMLSTGDIIKGAKGMNTILFKALTKYAHPSSKQVFMTATPIFDNISQIKELVIAMEPSAVINKTSKISDVINYLRGKVSYFPGTSVNAYPTVKYDIHEIPLSATQDDATTKVQESDGNDDTKEQFMAKQRQISLACLPNNVSVKDKLKLVVSNMPEYCPKVKALIDIIDKNPGKHVVFSNFIQYGLKVVETALSQQGWINIRIAMKDPAIWEQHKGKVYAFWDGSVKDAEKQYIKSTVNSVDNLFGDKIRVILGSPSIKEGVSFKHIQHMHILDPVWNISAKDQVEGRAIRYCSHIDIKPEHSPLKRSVVVNLYKIIPRKHGEVEQTCDQIIYDDIIVKKERVIRLGENALKKVAIDHYLFRNMYSAKKLVTPTSPLDSAASVIEMEEHENVVIAAKQINKKKNTCIKQRRPDNEGKCPDGHYVKKNLQGFDCCYKSKKTKNPILKDTEKQSSCPVKRRPLDGVCMDGFKLKINKNGHPCCYKNYQKKAVNETLKKVHHKN